MRCNEEEHNNLKNMLFDMAKSKGEYDSRLKALKELYKNVDNVDIDAELAADLVGDYLFSDPDFIPSMVPLSPKANSKLPLKS